MYEKFLSKESTWEHGHVWRRFLLNFVRIGRRFQLYWKAIHSGDYVTYEVIFNKGLGIFLLLNNKKNYVKIVMNSIDKVHNTNRQEHLKFIAEGNVVG